MDMPHDSAATNLATARIETRGRPLLLTPETCTCIVGEVERGATRKEAAARAGISGATLTKWMRRGRRGEEPYAGLARAIAGARPPSRALEAHAPAQSAPEAMAVRSPARLSEVAEMIGDFARVMAGRLKECEAAPGSHPATLPQKDGTQ